MHGFLIRVGSLELHVWEKCGADLFGLTGLEFSKMKSQWWQKQELFGTVLKLEWRLTFLPDRLMSVKWIVQRSGSETSLDSYHTASKTEEESPNYTVAVTIVEQTASSNSSGTLVDQIKSLGSCSVE